MRQPPAIFLAALATTAVLLGLASTQDIPDIECKQAYDPDAVDPGFGNWGDLTCDYGALHPSDQPSTMLSRDTVINPPDVAGELSVWFLEGYNATKVNFVNFGRLRGFANAIAIKYYPDQAMTSIETVVYFKAGEEARMLMEFYGFDLPERVKVPQIRRVSRPYP